MSLEQASGEESVSNAHNHKRTGGKSLILNQIKQWLIDLKEIIIVFFLAIWIMTFLISQNKVPSGSMMPTLNVNDRIIVSMLPYYYRLPQRGELVVFNGPDGKKWIKRVIGLPGETIDIREGDIYINDVCLDETAYLSEPHISSNNPAIVSQISFPYRVPENTYFLLGDNRLESYDCRYIGAISQVEITGKAIYRIYPFSKIGLIEENVYKMS